MKGKAPRLKAPFPAFGGKGAVAHLIWDRFGKVDNYIEPFFNSGAVMFRSPHGAARKETVNDKDHYISNFWRAVRAEPAVVAGHADWPVNEVDMHARHKWLVESPDAARLREMIRIDPKYYDPLIAGWWAWGQCMWIGSGWCSEKSRLSLPRLHHDQGLGTRPGERRQRIEQCRVSRDIPGLWQQRQRLGGYVGILNEGEHRPQLGDAYARGRGVHANDHANTCDERRAWLVGWMMALADRLRNVRVCCGDWLRVCKSPTVTTRLGLTGVFLDPPYRITLDSGEKSRDHVYDTDTSQDLDKLNRDVRRWCLKRGTEKQMRIALCSYEGEGNEELEAHGWRVMAWKSNGYGTSGKGKANAARERIWFSPHCLIPERDIMPLFAGIVDDA